MVQGFPTVIVRPEHRKSTEQVGSKEKFWFYRGQGDDEEEWMCKMSRRHAGEDWSEKIAAELCSLLGIPHAQYEMGTYETADESRRAIVTKRLDGRRERLILGEELLVDHVHRYERAPPDREYYINPEYSVSIVQRVLADERLSIDIPNDWSLPDEVDTPFGVFVGYLLLDAWIGNTDRHDQNWGVISSESPDYGETLTLAPTFDHASCLGREMPLRKKKLKLKANSDDHSVVGYLRGCKSRFVEPGPSGTQEIHVREAFKTAYDLDPAAGKAWLRRLSRIGQKSIRTLFNRVPSDRIDAASIDFGLRILEINKEHLLAYHDNSS